MMFNELCDRVDATVFSSDHLYDDEVRSKFRDMLARWTREIDSINKTKEKEEEDETTN